MNSVLYPWSLKKGSMADTSTIPENLRTCDWSHPGSEELACVCLLSQLLLLLLDGLKINLFGPHSEDRLAVLGIHSGFSPPPTEQWPGRLRCVVCGSYGHSGTADGGCDQQSGEAASLGASFRALAHGHGDKISRSTERGRA